MQCVVTYCTGMYS